MLTKRQKQILDYIANYINTNDYAPTLEEIGQYFKLSSVATIHQHIEGLQNKGYLKKTENQPRSIELNQTQDANTVDIPLLGVIAAGQPIEAMENPEMIQVPQSYLGAHGDYYALRVQGNSMIDEGIFDGDIVVIRKQATADDGQTVVAIIDDNEATLKKIYREKRRFRLQPANQEMLPIYRKDVEVRGIVVKLLRNLENGSRSRNGLVKHIIKKNKKIKHATI